MLVVPLLIPMILIFEFKKDPLNTTILLQTLKRNECVLGIISELTSFIR